MLAKQNQSFWTSLSARMVIAVAIEVVVVVALVFHNSEMWFGRYISIHDQSAFVGLVTVAVFVYLLRMRSRILKEARDSFIATIDEERARIHGAFAEMGSMMDKVQSSLTSQAEKAFAEAQLHLSVLEETLKTTALVGDVALENNKATWPDGFELAYQVRVAIDCIRFAVKATEHSVEEPNKLRQASLRQEASLQLLDALDRLQSGERSFQLRFRSRSSNGNFGTGYEGVNTRPIQDGIREGSF